jgi:CRISPR/Cas system CSM-associated protein Csm2 small subunit
MWQKRNLEMKQELEKKIEAELAKVRPSLGGADIRFGSISEGIVTVEYYRPLSNPTACHVDRTQITEDIIVEVLEDQLSKIIPGFKSVTLVGKD